MIPTLLLFLFFFTPLSSATKNNGIIAQSEKYKAAYQDAQQKSNQLTTLQTATTAAQGQFTALQNQLATLKTQKEAMITRIKDVTDNVTITKKNILETKLLITKTIGDLLTATDNAMQEARTLTEQDQALNLKNRVLQAQKSFTIALTQLEQNIGAAEQLLNQIRNFGQI